MSLASCACSHDRARRTAWRRRAPSSRSRFFVKTRRVEARLDHVHVEEPAEQQVVVELLAEQPLASHGVQRHQQRRLQQPLGRDRRPPHAAVHRVEHRRQSSASASSASFLIARSGCSAGTRASGDSRHSIDDCFVFVPRIRPSITARSRCRSLAPLGFFSTLLEAKRDSPRSSYESSRRWTVRKVSWTTSSRSAGCTLRRRALVHTYAKSVR